jgi:hypothetical protein
VKDDELMTDRPQALTPTFQLNSSVQKIGYNKSAAESEAERGAGFSGVKRRVVNLKFTFYLA